MPGIRNQCSACLRRGPDAHCGTCDAMFPNAQTRQILQCLECGDGEMMTLTDGWLMCGLCRHQVESEHYGKRRAAEAEAITPGQVKAMLAEDKRKGDKGGSGNDSGKPKDRRGGKVDPDTQSPGEGFKMGGRTRDDSVVWSKTKTLEKKTEVIKVRGLDATSDEIREALGEKLGETG